MADSQQVARQALHEERYFWGDIYKGTQEQLIAAGFARVGQFPGDPGCSKSSALIGADGELLQPRTQNAHISITRSGKQFRVRVNLDREAQEARKKEDEASEQVRTAAAALPEARAAALKALAAAEAELADLPDARKAFRKEAADSLWRWLHVYASMYLGDDHKSGFRSQRRARTSSGVSRGAYIGSYARRGRQHSTRSCASRAFERPASRLRSWTFRCRPSWLKARKIDPSLQLEE